MLKNIVLFLFIVLFTACGGGGGGDSTPAPSPDDSSTQAVSGYVVDNYIKNATVCIDSNKNNLCDTNETYTTTDVNGSFEFNIEVPSDSIIIAYGGEDSITGVSFNHLIKNIATNIDSNDKVILSSINTLITEVYLESNSTLPNAITLVNDFLGGTSQSIEETNIIEDVIANKSTQNDEFLRSLKLFQMVEKGANSIDSNLSIEIFNQLAKFIINNTTSTHESTDINVTINSVVKNLYVQDPYPVFVLKPSAEVKLGQRYVLDLNNSAVSPDGRSVSYKVVNDTNIFEINGTKIYFKTALSTTADYIVTIEANNSVKTNDINLSISVVNDTPILQAMANQAIDEDTDITLEIIANDIETTSLNYNASSSDSNVSISWNENNLTLTPDANWYGVSTIQVVVDDGDKNDTKSFTLTVNSINDAPTSSNLIFTINEDTNLSFSESNFTTVYSDIDLNPLSKIYITSLETNGALKFDGNDVVINQEINASDISKLKFIPVANDYGTPYSVFKYLVNDGDLNSSQEYNATINVKSVIDWNTPTDELRLLEDFGSYNLVIADIDTGGSEANLSYVLDKNESLTLPNNIEGVNDGDTVSIALNSKDNKNGEELLTLTLTRDSEILFTKEINVTVDAVNDQPIYNESDVDDMNISYGLNETVSISGIGAGGGTDEDTQTIYSYVTSSNTTVVNIEDISFDGEKLDFNLATGEPGVAEINVTLEDDGNNGVTGDNNTTSFTFEVRVRANGWKIYQDQKTSGYTINSVDFDGVSYDWNSTKKWYETTNELNNSNNKILLPLPIITSAYVDDDFNISNQGHYAVNKNTIIDENVTYASTGGSDSVYDHLNDTFLSADGTTRIKAIDSKYAYDGVNNFFVSMVLGNDTQRSYDNFQTTNYCENLYGVGWRLPTAPEVGNTDRISEFYGLYNGAYVGSSETNKILTSSFENGSSTKILNFRLDNAGWDINDKDTLQWYKCVYN